MKKWTTVDQALTSDGKPITLEEHDGSYTIRIDRVPLMSTRQHASEEKLAQLACAYLKHNTDARVLIGGLGFGYTLRATLQALAPQASVVVAEVLAEVIAWNRNPAYPLAADVLADPRVTLLHRDVADVIRAERGGFDAIMLDVDNGPDAMAIDRNRRLYDAAGLKLTRAALRPAGCVAYWSVEPDPAFEKLLARAGFEVEVTACRARPHGGSRHTIFLGRS
jgi:spermidine synthase